jgi:hypothetical protein
MATLTVVDMLTDVLSENSERPASLSTSNTQSQNYRTIDIRMNKITRTSKIILVILSILLIIELSSYNVSRIQELIGTLIGAPKTHSASSENRRLNFTKMQIASKS